MLFKSGGCLARTADVSSKIVKALEYLAEAGLVTSPPWRSTEAGHARILQCVSLQNSQKIFGRQTGPVEEATVFQLVLELDHLGWKHEVVTESMRKDVKKNQRMHQF